jgi:hypothetical protein
MAPRRLVEEVPMYHHEYHESWDWLWMSLVMGLWIVVLAVVAFLGVRAAIRELAERTDHDTRLLGRPH